jgi:competence protein ComEA
VERPFPWRVVEDVPDAAGSFADGGSVPPGPQTAQPPAPPSSAAPPGRSAAAPAGDRRRLAAAVVALGGAVVATVVALAVVLGGSPGTNLALPGDAAGRLTGSRLVGAGGPLPTGLGDVIGDSRPLLVVDVAGAVRNPGVYRLPEGSRVVDAVAAAGGYGTRVDAAAASRLNLAAPLKDGEQVRVPSRDDAEAAAPAGSPRGGTASDGGSTSGGPVNLNTASAAELDTLPGVGPATAAKIIAAREEAPFGTVDELRSRGVVGEATFGKLRDLVTVGP